MGKTWTYFRDFNILNRRYTFDYWTFRRFARICMIKWCYLLKALAIVNFH